MRKKIAPTVNEIVNDVKRTGETASVPPRSLAKGDRPTTTAILTELSKLLALCEQGLLQPPVTLTANGHRHVGETLAQARSVLARSRGQGAV